MVAYVEFRISRRFKGNPGIGGMGRVGGGAVKDGLGSVADEAMGQSWFAVRVASMGHGERCPGVDREVSAQGQRQQMHFG